MTPGIRLTLRTALRLAVAVFPATVALAHDADEHPAPTDEVFAPQSPAEESDPGQSGDFGETEGSEVTAAPQRARTVARPHRVHTLSLREITRESLRTLPQRSAEDVLRVVPGIVVVQHGSAGKGPQFFVRGFDAAHGSDVQLSVAGISLNESANVHAHGYLDLGLIIPEAIERVSVQTGPFSPDAGPFATAARIDYALGNPVRESGVLASAETATSGRARGLVAAASESDDWMAIEGAWDRGYGENRELGRVAVNASASIAREAHPDVELTLLGAWNQFGLGAIPRWADVQDERIAWTGAWDDRLDGETGRAMLVALVPFSSGRQRVDWRSSASVRTLALDQNYTGYLLNPTWGDTQQQRERRLQGTTALEWNAPWLPSFRSRAIAELTLDRIDSEARSRAEADGSFGVERSLAATQLMPAVAVGGSWTPAPWFEVSPTVRWQAWSAWADAARSGTAASGDAFVQAVLPRIVVLVSPRAGVEFSVAAGQGVRPPEAAVVAQLPPDPGQRRLPGAFMRSTATELAVRVQPLSTLRLGLVGWYTWVPEEQLFDHISGTTVLLGATDRFGTELDVRWRPTLWSEVTASFTWQRGTLRSGEGSVPGVPDWMSQLQASLRHPTGWRAGVQIGVLGTRRLAFGASWPTSVASSLTAGYTRGAFDIAVEVDNPLVQRFAEGVYNFASAWDRTVPASRIPAIHVAPGSPLLGRLRVTWTW